MSKSIIFLTTLLSLINLTGCDQKSQTATQVSYGVSDTVEVFYRLYNRQKGKAVLYSYYEIPEQIKKTIYNTGKGKDTMRIKNYEVNFSFLENGKSVSSKSIDKYYFEKFIDDSNYLELAYMSSAEFKRYDAIEEQLIFNCFLTMPESDYAFSFDLFFDKDYRIVKVEQPRLY